jgi:hypothetical protein
VLAEAALREEEGKEDFKEEDARQLLKVDIAFISYTLLLLTTTQREREKEGKFFLRKRSSRGKNSFLFFFVREVRERRERKI